jgi:acyl-CoA synthetase (AMP-forming)/AMP-acid ligase II
VRLYAAERLQTVSEALAATVELLSRYLDLNNSSVIYSNELHLLLDDVGERNITHLLGMPSHFERLLDHSRRTRQRLVASLRVMLLGSATVDTRLLERFGEIVSSRTRVWCVYGMTEASRSQNTLRMGERARGSLACCEGRSWRLTVSKAQAKSFAASRSPP